MQDIKDIIANVEYLCDRVYDGQTSPVILIGPLEKCLRDLRKLESEYDRVINQAKAEGVDSFADECIRTGRLTDSDPSLFRIRKFAENIRKKV